MGQEVTDHDEEKQEYDNRSSSFKLELRPENRGFKDALAQRRSGRWCEEGNVIFRSVERRRRRGHDDSR